jgi:IS5 family transposase
MMFKAILLGQWHSLSDRQLEESLLVRIDFMQFCGLDLSDAVPDETTLCRFRNRLIKAELLEGLLRQINEMLQGHGLMGLVLIFVCEAFNITTILVRG